MSRSRLGTHDVSDRLLIPEKLYGREADSTPSWRHSSGSPSGAT